MENDLRTSVVRPAEGILTGRVVRLMEGYPREIKVGQPVLVAVVTAASEVELHGHLPQSALHPADHVQLTLRRQPDEDRPPRVERIVNLTTGQLLRPRTATVWSHLGPPLLLQAALGALLVAGLAACSVLTG